MLHSYLLVLLATIVKMSWSNKAHLCTLGDNYWLSKMLGVINTKTEFANTGEVFVPCCEIDSVRGAGGLEGR